MRYRCDTEKKKGERREEGKDTVRVDPSDFEDFWKAFPHRNGKKTQKAKAIVAFSAALKSGVTVQQIAQGVEAMRRDPDVHRGYGAALSRGSTSKVGQTKSQTQRPNSRQSPEARMTELTTIAKTHGIKPLLTKSLSQQELDDHRANVCVVMEMMVRKAPERWRAHPRAIS